ncbi:MAG: glycosyltransferase family 1 protein [Planctomycetota bacterium]
MRIGLDYRPALVNREGIGRYTRELVRALVELEFGPNLGLFAYTLGPGRIPRAELGLDARAELVRLRFPSRWMPGLLRLLGKGVDDLVGGANVYHHTQYRRLAVREAVEVATIHDCIYLLDAGYDNPDSAATMAAEARELVKHARRVLVPTEFVGAEVVMKLGVWPNKIAVTGLGCDHVARRLAPGGYGPAPERYVLTVTRVDARKNHLRMLAAFERLVADGLPHRWIVCGPAGYGSADFERALDRSPARERVLWKRAVGEDELVRLYAQAEVFLFTSLHEGFGLPPLEAMACGTPVITSCITSMPEVVGDAAWLVEPTDVDQTYDALRRLVDERDLALDLTQRGQRRAREFTWRETARKTLLAYSAALEPEDGPKLRRSL